jgi:benzylsuccinate CoA-transferase BbsF subunit
MEMTRKSLKGVKVADFSWALVGPMTTKALADYGAQVVKVESGARPGTLRVVGSTESPAERYRAARFAQWNTSKLGITLNLSKPGGVEMAKRLVSWADVVVENFAGGVMERLGLGYEEVRKAKPDIIMLSTCMMGQTGPYASLPGFGGHLTAMTGFNYITGWPDRDPVELGVYTDFIAPHFAISIILAALLYRQRTGKGQYIDLSQYECAIQFMAPVILDYVANGRIAERMGNRSPYACPHGAYRCLGEDRWCAIAVYTDEEWDSFCKVIGNPSWTEEPEFGTFVSRKENEEELDRLVEEWTSSRSAEEVMALMQTAGVPAGAMYNSEDLLERDPQLKHRRLFRELDHTEIGKHHAPRPTFLLSKMPCKLRPYPVLGEHNQYVFKDILGLSDAEINKLSAEGVIE